MSKSPFELIDLSVSAGINTWESGWESLSKQLMPCP